MIDQLQRLLEQRVQQCVSDRQAECSKIERKKECLANRHGEIVKAKSTGHITDKMNNGDHTDIYYNVHFQYLIKQEKRYYIEEEVEKRKAHFYKSTLLTDEEIFETPAFEIPEIKIDRHENLERISYHYDRRKAVQYAERWWNDYNPQYHKFDVDCTNYISQCLHAGGAPMRGFSNRSSGWWYNGNSWSYSWSVAHSLRWYLGTSKVGLRAREVSDPGELQLGDIICYDFEGDGRFNHTTIVTAKDAYGMPLVNAHTTNSRMRYWSYEDSSAYTDNIQYKFFTIIDDD
ncbi:amidase domain-containing protein [Caldifermentibacillus hisashii]|uniref:amidase domain-containing protein n=1 Tax=Caldifermentibacillus hisashii TaxID=996558 RepID=UPI002E1F102B|nr:amidase domain-containing protein [Caldifermentibacillus hisashii]